MYFLIQKYKGKFGSNKPRRSACAYAKSGQRLYYKRTLGRIIREIYDEVRGNE